MGLRHTLCSSLCRLVALVDESHFDACEQVSEEHEDGVPPPPPDEPPPEELHLLQEMEAIRAMDDRIQAGH
jgi:hypothetical protein